MNLKPLIVASTIAFAINGCSSSSSVSVTGSGSGTGLEVMGVSGVVVNLNGTWARPCYTDQNANPVVDVLSKHVFSGTAMTITESTFTSVDASCSGTETVLYTIDLTATIGATTAISGWVDGQGSTITGPTAQDATGALGDNEAITVLTATITAVSTGVPMNVGDAFDIFYVVDDTVPASPVMYGDTDYAAGATTADGFDELIRQ